MKNPSTARICGRALATALAVAFSGLAAVSAAPKYKQMPEDSWVAYVDDALGYNFYYPSTFFEPQAIATDMRAKTFLSPDKRAKIVVSAVENDEGFTLAGYRSAILGEFGGYDQLDYSPKGQSWFVLSGFRGENIYYQKVLFSCGNRIINVFSITFPTYDRAFYEGLVEVMEDNFRPGTGRNTPAVCR
jgi:hypothetical protein